MAGETEAECLFETGALYGTRVLLRPSGGDPVFAGFKPGAFSVYFGDAPIVHYDRDGRWQRAYVDGLHYLKGLDGTVQTIDRVREGPNLVLKRRTLSFAEAGAADATARGTALDLIDALDHGRLSPSGPPPKGRLLAVDELRAFLERVARWDAAAWFAHREKYLACYGPPPFLPPDCPSPVILQATVGHEGGVTFGGAPAVAHDVRTPDAFDRHAREVADLLGRRVEQCKAVFLGGSDVLRRPVGDVAAYLEAAARVFPVEPTDGRRHPDPTGETPHRLDGIHAFLDRFETPLPSPDDWRRFRALGLTRVILGVESGDPGVRALFAKSWADDALRATVSGLKAAAIGVGLAVLVGAGGVEGEASHLAATAALVNALDLGPGDLVSLLDAREVAGAEPLAFTPLSDPAFDAQRDELKSRLAPVRTAKKAKVVPYSLEKQGLG
jgi:hypothetical protein